MTTRLFGAFAAWLGLRSTDDAFAFAAVDLEPEEELFDPSISPLEEFR